MMSNNPIPRGTSSRTMPDKVVVVHGFGATVEDHWFGWLAEHVPQAVLVPLPAPEHPDAATWIPRVAEAIGRPEPATAVVAHSLGCVTAVQAVLRSRSTPGDQLGAFVAVAPFAAELPPTGYAALDTFSSTTFGDFIRGLDLPTARPALGRVTVLRSDNDALVPAALSDDFARDLGAPVQVLPGPGHFLDDDGVTELPAVLQALLP